MIDLLGSEAHGRKAGGKNRKARPKADVPVAAERAAGSARRTPERSSARSTVSGPSRRSSAARDAAAAKLEATEIVAEAFPFNAAKPSEFGEGGAEAAAGPDRRAAATRGSAAARSPSATRRAKTGKPPRRASIPGSDPLDRVRVDSGGPRADDESRRPDRRQPELAQGGAARTDAARRLHPAREDHALRSRAHSRAHRARARLGRARLLRVLRAADGPHARVDLRRGGQAHAGVRALLDGRRRARLDRHRARRARLRGEVLHRRRQLGSRRQQHPGVLHPGRDEVSRPRPRGEAGAASRACRRRRRRTTRSGISCR